MAHSGQKASKHEYNKPQLKEQIDSAMAAFIKSGRAVERVPSQSAADPNLGQPADPPAAEEEAEVSPP